MEASASVWSLLSDLPSDGGRICKNMGKIVRFTMQRQVPWQISHTYVRTAIFSAMHYLWYLSTHTCQHAHVRTYIIVLFFHTIHISRNTCKLHKPVPLCSCIPCATLWSWCGPVRPPGRWPYLPPVWQVGSGRHQCMEQLGWSIWWWWWWGECEGGRDSRCIGIIKYTS